MKEMIVCFQVCCYAFSNYCSDRSIPVMGGDWLARTADV